MTIIDRTMDDDPGPSDAVKVIPVTIITVVLLPDCHFVGQILLASAHDHHTGYHSLQSSTAYHGHTAMSRSYATNAIYDAEARAFVQKVA